MKRNWYVDFYSNEAFVNYCYFRITRIEAIYLLNLNGALKTLAYNSWKKLTFKSQHFSVKQEK